MIHFPSFFSTPKKICRICHKGKSKHNICNNCLDRVEELVFEKIKYGTEIKTDSPELDLYCRLVEKGLNSE